MIARQVHFGRRGWVALGAAVLFAAVLTLWGACRWRTRSEGLAERFRPTRDDLPALGKKNQQSVAEAGRLGRPERLSPLLAAPAFDVEAFQRDPEAYLGVVEPARCFQTASAAAPDRVYLAAMTDLDAVVNEGVDATLVVRSVPNMPVTFTAFGAGSFRENDLSSVTVKADARGFAMVHAVPPPVGAGDMRVQAGSPVAVGNQVFAVRRVGQRAN